MIRYLLFVHNVGQDNLKIDSFVHVEVGDLSSPNEVACVCMRAAYCLISDQSLAYDLFQIHVLRPSNRGSGNACTV